MAPKKVAGRKVRCTMSAAKEIAIVQRSEEHFPKPREEAGRSMLPDANGAEVAGTNGSPAVRRRLPDERHSVTHHFSVGGQEGYVTVGLYEDGLPGELFIRMAKEGSTVSGLMDSFATAVSLALQYGVPLQVLCDKFSHTRFEPSGWSGNPKIGYAKSLTDYLFRWLELRFLKGEQGLLFELPKFAQPQREVTSAIEGLGQVVELGDAPPCQFCGSLMVRNGSCHRCMTCGSTSGCS
jgi:ribonucleoside-diphosphate reductase alpha chain